jgi:hypothetical protein
VVKVLLEPLELVLGLQEQIHMQDYLVLEDLELWEELLLMQDQHLKNMQLN